MAMAYQIEGQPASESASHWPAAAKYRGYCSNRNRRSFRALWVDQSVPDRGPRRHDWATNDLEMDDLQRLRFAEASWKIEEYHRGLSRSLMSNAANAAPRWLSVTT